MIKNMKCLHIFTSIIYICQHAFFINRRRPVPSALSSAGNPMGSRHMCTHKHNVQDFVPFCRRKASNVICLCWEDDDDDLTVVFLSSTFQS